jgi:hypothetical protein
MMSYREGRRDTLRGLSMSFRTDIVDAFRLATWRVPHARTAGMTPLTAFGLFAIIVLVTAIDEFIGAGASLQRFSPHGINSIVAGMTVQALVISSFSRKDPSSQTFRNLVLLCLVSSLIGLLIAITSALADATMKASVVETVGFTLIWAAWIVWFLGAARQAFKAMPGVRWPGLRGFRFLIVSMIAVIALPIWPVFEPPHFKASTANFWEIAHEIARQIERKSPAGTEEYEKLLAEARANERARSQMEARQGMLMTAAIDAIGPRDPNAANVFVLGVAGSDEQDVFRLETQQSLSILENRFHARMHTVSLINNSAVAQERPMASIQNIATALRVIGARMDAERDLLILTMTSHGSPDGFALEYGEFVERTLDPQMLKTMLAEAGIKNRILIVSSCYSGTFVAPLADADTAIITAASATNTSFGCANDREWTYFGEAFFEKGLTRDATMAEAFKSAKVTIATWESEQKLPPSDPQIAIGEGIARRFPELVGPAEFGSAAAAEAGPTRVKSE